MKIVLKIVVGTGSMLTDSEVNTVEHGRKTGRSAADRRLFSVVLAAGRGVRFGSTKQLAPYRGTCLVARAVRLAESVCGDRTVLVAGHEWQSVVAACRPLRGFFANNTAHQAGMGTSIACGVSSVLEAADAVLLLLADQPLITTAHLKRMETAWMESPDAIVATVFSGTMGPPVLFPRGDFGHVASLGGDQGARHVLARAGERVRGVAFEEAAVDIDVTEDLQGLQ